MFLGDFPVSGLWIMWVILFNRYFGIIPTFTNKMLRKGLYMKMNYPQLILGFFPLL